MSDAVTSRRAQTGGGEAPAFEGTLPELLRAHAAERGDQDALVARSAYGEQLERLTYAELAAAAERCAHALRGAGIRRGDRVALLFDNQTGLEAMVALYGVHAAGAVTVPINTRFSRREVSALVEFSGARLIVGGAEVLTRLGEGLAAEAGAEAMVAAGEPTAGATDWREWIAAAPRSGELEAPAPDDDADWLFTSGTTGSPKCVITTHRGCVATGAVLSGAFEIGPGDVLQTPFPFYTSSGCHTSALSALYPGAVYLMEPEIDVAQIAARLRSEGVTVFGAVPAVYVYLLDSGLLDPAALGKVKTIFIGGAPLIPSLVEGMEAAFPAAEVVNVYGLTEAGNAGLSLRGSEVREHLGSIGRVGTPFTDFRLVAEDGSEVEPGGVGEIWLRGPSIMAGYHRNDAATAEALVDGWLRTADLARIDEQGYLYVFDRRKDVIIRGGFNISSVEIESTLAAHPGVLEAAVAAKPHHSLGEDIRAFVVAGEEPPSVEDLRAFCAERLADFKVPRDIVFLDELPRNATGKVQKAALREWSPPEGEG